MSVKINVILGDITKINVDAIVNAANESLLGGGGVDGAIHQAAGKELLKECKSLGGCETGEAKITKGYKLPAKYIIHTVGPVYHDGQHNEAEKLAKAYQSSLSLATQYSCKTVAFPSISTGAFGYPLGEGAEIAVKTVMDYCLSNKEIEHVTFVCFNEKTKMAYETAVGKGELNSAYTIDQAETSQKDVHQAIVFATLAHQHQKRKGTDIPYIVHPFEVSQILTQFSENQNLIIAGLLHDTLEDTDITQADVYQNFGKPILDLVMSCSEDKSKSWEARKQHTIDYLKETENIDEILLCFADKLSNLRSICDDFREIGDEIWNRFNRGKEQISWYYSELNYIFNDKMQYSSLLKEYNSLFQEVFADGDWDVNKMLGIMD